ncbi:hypothetical protein [Thauera aromatica]|uniref:hypothetical protein n=1 Tax=Thauera aromatica TaxID=59405 RepID=UPI001FFC48FB|nr:hypothetical protein [Thauera aromatica]MCK2097068.1 hypothetical protein [Thauera aromatica]
MKPLKPWLSFPEQLQQLQARGLHVDDHAAALDYLECLGRYRPRHVPGLEALPQWKRQVAHK